MKKIVIMSLLLVIAINKSSAQCDSTKLCYYNRDTTAYFKNVFENKKSIYINQPLEKLIYALEVKPFLYYYWVAYMKIDSCDGIKLFFSPTHNFNKRTKIRIKLLVTFENLIGQDSCTSQSILDRGFWLYSTRQFYGNRIVKDFKFVEVRY